MRMGAVLKCAEYKVSPIALDGLLKSGQGGGLTALPANVAKAIAAVALLTGIPAGIAAHSIGRQVSKKDRREEEMQKRIQYYRNASKQLEQGLASTGARV